MQNDQTYQLIEKLANKLGVTADHLWSVLVRQAPIEACIDAFQIIILFVTAYFFAQKAIAVWKLNSHERGHEWLAVILTIVAINFGILSIGCAWYGGSEIISALSNPEYWALKQIIK